MQMDSEEEKSRVRFHAETIKQHCHEMSSKAVQIRTLIEEIIDHKNYVKDLAYEIKTGEKL